MMRTASKGPKCRRFTPQERAEIIRLARAGVPARDIARRLGASRNACTHHIVAAGVRPSEVGIIGPPKGHAIRSMDEVAAILGVSRGTVFTDERRAISKLRDALAAEGADLEQDR